MGFGGGSTDGVEPLFRVSCPRTAALEEHDQASRHKEIRLRRYLLIALGGSLGAMLRDSSGNCGGASRLRGSNRNILDRCECVFLDRFRSRVLEPSCRGYQRCLLGRRLIRRGRLDGRPRRRGAWRLHGTRSPLDAMSKSDEMSNAELSPRRYPICARAAAASLPTLLFGSRLSAFLRWSVAEALSPVLL